MNLLGVRMTYPEGTIHTASKEGLAAVKNVKILEVSIRMLAEEEQFLGVGSDSLEAIKSDFKDVLCSSLGEAAGYMKGEKMKIHLDENKEFCPCQVTTVH